MVRFGFGDIVKIRDEELLAKIVCEIIDEDDSVWYEVLPRDSDIYPMSREVKESDLTLVK